MNFMEPIIEVNNISKKYQIGTKQRYVTLRESIMTLSETPWNFFRRSNNTDQTTFWALRDVSFQVMPGEILGIIGANGAGKSTILKILSRITYPTLGEVKLRGRISSLLEVGTGFHQELTGRENVFLNGVILGMKRSEIKRKFDEIVSFAGVEKFIDTPVKHYSSGMYVRLAFAIAAHLNTDILLVDEVLAVGDIEFQKKSLNKMEKITEEGRTVIFVSHNVEAIQRLCNWVLLFEKGKVTADSPDVSGVTTAYLERSRVFSKEMVQKTAQTRQGSGQARFSSVALTNLEGKKIDHVIELTPFKILLEINAAKSIEVGTLAVTFVDQGNQEILATFAQDSFTGLRLHKGKNSFEILVNPNPFAPGIFSLELVCLGHDGEAVDIVRNMIAIQVVSKPGEINYMGRVGLMRLSLPWIKI